jgi:Fe-S-cluster containining protein
MFVVDKILISDELVGASFCCNLGACHGACCVHGDSGAPILPEEREELESVLPLIAHRLSKNALRVIDEKGVWEKTSSGAYATTCVGSAECVFVVYDGEVAKCAIEQAHNSGETDFPKPISCHLYPVRIEDLGDFDAANYEQIEICKPGRKYGRRKSIPLVDFLKVSLTRKYGPEWYSRLRTAYLERVSLFQETVR